MPQDKMNPKAILEQKESSQRYSEAFMSQEERKPTPEDSQTVQTVSQKRKQQVISRNES